MKRSVPSSARGSDHNQRSRKRMSVTEQKRMSVAEQKRNKPINNYPCTGSRQSDTPFNARLRPEFSLYDYQKSVVEWITLQEYRYQTNVTNRNHNPHYASYMRGGMICLKMGLGKTFLALYHVLRARHIRKERFPTLVVMSKTLLYEWKVQGVEKFFTGVKAMYLHKDLIGARAFKNLSASDLVNFDIVFTTYDVITSAYRSACKDKEFVKSLSTDGKSSRKPVYTPDNSGFSLLLKMPWERIICDESQRFANFKTQTFRAMMALWGQFKWCLTGTPFRNYETDIWSQLRFCGFERITSPRQWTREQYISLGCQKSMYVLSYEGANVKMPELLEKMHHIQMTGGQLALYKTTLEQIDTAISNYLAGCGVTYIMILALFLRLRQIAIAPHLMVIKKSKSTTTDEITKSVESDKIVEWLGDRRSTAGTKRHKLQTVSSICCAATGMSRNDSIQRAFRARVSVDNTTDEEVVDLKRVRDVALTEVKREKVLIFRAFTTAIDLCKDALNECGIQCKTMTGDTNVRERMEIIELFKTSSTMNVLLLNYKVGSEGLNLIEATHVIPLEPWWTHSVHSQGIFRAWRRGQKNTVTVHWVVSLMSIEQSILELCQAKASIGKGYMTGDFTGAPVDKPRIDIAMMKTMIEKYKMELNTPERRVVLQNNGEPTAPRWAM